MKKYTFLLISIVILTSNVNSQLFQENTTYTDNHLNKFEGTWMWSSANDTVKLQLKKISLHILDVENSYWEFLLGCHSYTKNGILLESSMNKYDSLSYYTYTNKIGSLRLFRLEDGDTSFVEGTIKDISKHKGNQIDLTYLGGNPAQIRMQLSLKGAKISLPGKPYIPGITLPTDIILTKQ